MDRVRAYQDMEDLVDDLRGQIEEARWKQANLIWNQRGESSVDEIAKMLGCGKHHVIYMTNCWDRRGLKPEDTSFSAFYNSILVRGMDPRKPRKLKILIASYRLRAAEEVESGVEEIDRERQEMAREIVPDDYDYEPFITQELSATMDEFIDWLHKFVPYKKLDDRSAFLGARLYGYFQASESHQEVVAERKAAREAAEEPEAAPAPAIRRGRGRLAAVAEPAPTPAKVAAVKPRGRKPAPVPEPEEEEEAPAPKPRARRGRPANAEAAPY